MSDEVNKSIEEEKYDWAEPPDEYETHKVLNSVQNKTSLLSKSNKEGTARVTHRLRHNSRERSDDVFFTVEREQKRPQDLESATYYKQLRVELASLEKSCVNLSELIDKASSAASREFEERLLQAKRRIWVIRGVLGHGHDEHKCMIVSKNMEKIQMVPSDYLYPELLIRDKIPASLARIINLRNQK